MKYLIPLLISVTLLVGGVPQKISYQGYVTHSDGELVQDGNYDVTFRLFEAVEGGDALWEEEHTLLIGSGLISVVLGGKTPLSFSESMSFLEIVINGEVLTPRQELTTVFYAFHSESAVKASTADFATTAAIADTALVFANYVKPDSVNYATTATIADTAIVWKNYIEPDSVKYATNSSKADTALYSIEVPTVSYNNLSDKPTIPSSIGDLSNVDLTNIASGKILKYDETDSKFEVGDDVTGATNLSGLSDVDLTNVADGKILKYSGTSSKFVVSDDAAALNTSSETYSITGTSTSAGTLMLYEDTDDGTNYVGLKTGTMGSDVTYTLPTADGSSAQVLSTDGNSVLSWSTVSSLTNTTTTIGTGSADANLASNGNYDLILKTGNSTTGSITVADGADGNISITPNGTGEVDISKVDIDGGTIDGTAIGANSSVAGTFSNLQTGSDGTDGHFTLYSEQGATDYSVVFQPNAAMTQSTTYTLPAGDGTTNQVLTTDGEGALNWTSTAVGDITSVGDATSGEVFTADGSGNTLYFEGTNANTSEIAVVGADPSADVTVTIPATTGTLYISGGTDVAVADGGTGASDAAGARINLGLAIGTDVQAYDSDLDAIVALAKTDGNFVVGSGTAWVVESGATARTSLGLGSMATQAASSVDIDGGAIDGTAIGANSASTGAFSTLSSTGNTTLGDENSDVVTVTGTVAGASPLVLEGATPDDYETTIAVTDPTADRTLMLPDATGTVFVSGTAVVADLLDGSTSGGSGNLFIGTSAGAAIQSGGEKNTGFGYEALKFTTTGDHNTASGSWALYSNNTGYQNTASGYRALYSNTTGSKNTASGLEALYSNTTGAFNTAHGNTALYSNTTAINNTASGWRALYSNTTGGYNTASGSQALSSNTTGYENTASGYRTLTSNTTGSRNTASGYQALYSNTTGEWNTASGYQALFSNTTGASNNTASGYRALYSNTTGEFNTASGSQALYSNTTGICNIASGYRTLTSNTTGSNNTASGHRALYNNTTAHYNTAVGYGSLFLANRTVDIDGYNTAVGYEAGDVITTGQHNVIIGAASDPSANTAVNQIVIGYAATGTGNNQIALGNTSIVAIKAQVNSITAYSDRRIKWDIQDSNLGLAFINELRPVKYKLKNPADYPETLLEDRFKSGKDERPEDDGTVYDGLTAQEVKSSLDKLGVSWSGWSEDENTGKQGIQYGALVVPLIKAVQELSVKVEELEGQINHLEGTGSDLSASEGIGQLANSN